ncbi:hypothetical protein TNCV_2001391 [Trichonephila clavipes]|nr:hypothetical protein TNCV_2001391 [Trichonephila clavipes]
MHASNLSRFVTSRRSVEVCWQGYQLRCCLRHLVKAQKQGHQHSLVDTAPSTQFLDMLDWREIWRSEVEVFHHGSVSRQFIETRAICGMASSC